MKKYLFPAGAVAAVVLWAVSFGPAYAADSTFSVDSYIPQKFTDFQLRLDGGLRIEGERTEAKPSSEEGDDLGEQIKSYDVQELRGALATNYRYETIPHYLRLSLAAAGYDFNLNGGTGYIPDWPKRFQKGIQLSIDAGVYLFSDFFLALEGYGAWDYGGTTTGIETTHGRAYFGEIDVFPGWGRTYEGEYAATGMYIIKELRDDGILDREPDFEEMLTLTELIYHYRQTHAIDTRLHKIEALTRIMEYLQEIEAIDSTGPYGYLLIQDVWDYFPTFSRRFGHRFRVGGGMQYSYSSNDLTRERKTDGITTSHIYNHYRTTKETPYIAVLMESHHPLGLRWQIDLEGKSLFLFDRRYKYERLFINYMSGSNQPLERVTNLDADRQSLLTVSLRYILDSRSNARLTATHDWIHYHMRTTHLGTPT